MRPYIVVDASVAGAWSFTEPFTSQAQAVLSAIAARRVIAIAPDRFVEEMLRICQKKTQASLRPVGVADAWDRFVDVVSSPIVFFPSDEFHERAWQLATSLSLTTHDALYLAAAEHWDAELWTLDEHLGQPHPIRQGSTHDLRTEAFRH
jgi:predicted nucleic acid-binding protein